jgi:hypothetical protein
MIVAQGKLSPQAKVLAIVGVSAALGWLFDVLLFGKMFGIGFPLYVSLIIIGLISLATYFRKTFDKQVTWLFISLLAFSLMIAVRTSFFLTFLNLLACLLILLIITATSFKQNLIHFRLADYAKLTLLPFRWVDPFFRTFAELATIRSSDKHRETAQRILKGLMLTVPVIAVFILLLSSADLVFQRYLSNFITLQPETLARLMNSTVVAVLFMGAYAYIFYSSQNEAARKSEHSRGFSLGSIESSMLLGSLSLLFAIFILVQFAYLFGGVETVLAQGFTYADYARRGFFELVETSALALFLLIAVEAFVIKLDKSHLKSFRWLSSTLVLEVLLIMGSAIKRLALYESAYGFSIARLYAHVIIFFLAAIFGLLLYKIHKDAREETFAFRSFITALLFLGIMNGINPDAFIARQNINRYVKTNQLDVVYLTQLSDDALPETMKVLDIKDEQLRGLFASTTYRNQVGRIEAKYQDWQSLNFSSTKADRLLQSQMKELEQYKDFITPESTPALGKIAE